jgi:hypothetical protein
VAPQISKRYARKRVTSSEIQEALEKKREQKKTALEKFVHKYGASRHLAQEGERDALTEQAKSLRESRLRASVRTFFSDLWYTKTNCRRPTSRFVVLGTSLLEGVSFLSLDSNLGSSPVFETTETASVLNFVLIISRDPSDRDNPRKENNQRSRPQKSQAQREQ